MDQKSLLILENFDLRKLSRECNIHDCNKEPSKKIILIEHDFRTMKDTEIASLYFCSEHYKTNLRMFLEKLSNTRKDGKIIRTKVVEMGFITH